MRGRSRSSEGAAPAGQKAAGAPAPTYTSARSLAGAGGASNAHANTNANGSTNANPQFSPTRTALGSSNSLLRSTSGSGVNPSGSASGSSNALLHSASAAKMQMRYHANSSSNPSPAHSTGSPHSNGSFGGSPGGMGRPKAASTLGIGVAPMLRKKSSGYLGSLGSPARSASGQHQPGNAPASARHARHAQQQPSGGIKATGRHGGRRIRLLGGRSFMYSKDPSRESYFKRVFRSPFARAGMLPVLPLGAEEFEVTRLARWGRKLYGRRLVVSVSSRTVALQEPSGYVKTYPCASIVRLDSSPAPGTRNSDRVVELWLAQHATTGTMGAEMGGAPAPLDMSPVPSGGVGGGFGGSNRAVARGKAGLDLEPLLLEPAPDAAGGSVRRKSRIPFAAALGSSNAAKGGAPVGKPLRKRFEFATPELRDTFVTLVRQINKWATLSSRVFQRIQLSASDGVALIPVASAQPMLELAGMPREEARALLAFVDRTGDERIDPTDFFHFFVYLLQGSQMTVRDAQELADNLGSLFTGGPSGKRAGFSRQRPARNGNSSQGPNQGGEHNVRGTGEDAEEQAAADDKNAEEEEEEEEDVDEVSEVPFARWDGTNLAFRREHAASFPNGSSRAVGSADAADKSHLLREPFQLQLGKEFARQQAAMQWWGTEDGPEGNRRIRGAYLAVEPELVPGEDCHVREEQATFFCPVDDGIARPVSGAFFVTNYRVCFVAYQSGNLEPRVPAVPRQAARSGALAEGEEAYVGGPRLASLRDARAELSTAAQGDRPAGPDPIVWPHYGEDEWPGTATLRSRRYGRRPDSVLIAWYVPLSALWRVRPVAGGLQIQSKDQRSMHLAFDQSEEWLQAFAKELTRLRCPADVTGTFAFSHAHAVRASSALAVNGWNLFDARFEFTRQGVFNLRDRAGRQRFHLYEDGYKLSPTYPARYVLPTAFDVTSKLPVVAKYRSRGRVPVLTWAHPSNGAVLARSAQSRAGITLKRCPEDSELLTMFENEENPGLIIVDARPFSSAFGNQVARGAGPEHPKYYPNATVLFMGIPNIHKMRSSYHKLGSICAPGTVLDDDQNWLSKLEATQWLAHLRLLLEASTRMAEIITIEQTSVLVHCSDGWDRAGQLSALTQLLLDPYFRTLEGFAVLVEKDFCSFGHKFADRYGHPGGKMREEERSPIFIQFLDAVHQIMRQFPRRFEFNERLLCELAGHVYSARFGTFLFNTEQSREQSAARERTESVWTHVLALAPRLFVNAEYEPLPGVLWPSTSSKFVVLWERLFMAGDMQFLNIETCGQRMEPLSHRQEVASSQPQELQAKKTGHEAVAGRKRRMSDMEPGSFTAPRVDPPAV